MRKTFKKKKRLILLTLISIFLLIFSLSEYGHYYWFRGITALYSFQSKILDINSKDLPKNTLFFYRNTSSIDENDSGIWTSTGLAESERQIISLKEINIIPFDSTKQRLKFYARPVISPDKSKIAFFVGVEDIDFNIDKRDDIQASLYVYDIRSGKLNLLMQNLYLKSGYIQSIEWHPNSSFIIITHSVRGLYKLGLINMKGNYHNINYLSHNVFWPTLINNHQIVSNTSLPNNHWLALININTLSSKVFNFNKFSTYLIGRGLYKKKDDLFVSLSESGSSPNQFKEDEISGLVRFNLKTEQVQKFKIPSNYSNTVNNSFLDTQLICNNIALLIEKDIDTRKAVSNKNGDQYYFFNLDSLNLEKVAIRENLTYYPECDSENNNITQVTKNYVNVFPTENSLAIQSYNYTNPLKKLGILEDDDLARNLFDIQNQFLILEITQAFHSQPNKEKLGLYVVDSINSSASQYSYPSSYDYQDIYIYFFKP